MDPAFQALLERYLAGSFDKQLYLAELIGQAGWSLDVTAGAITFGESFRWHVQVLGMVSARSGEWQWTWATEGMLDESLQRIAQGMRRLGAMRDIPELITARQEGGESIGLRLALMACGIFNCNAFYRAPYEGGAAFLLICDPSFPRNDVTPAVRIPTVLPQVLQRFPHLNQRRVLLGYLKDYGLSEDAQGQDLIIFDHDAPVMRARFNANDRLAGIDVL